MRLVEMTSQERQGLEGAQQQVRRVREWRRLQAVKLLADGQDVNAVAQALDCSPSSVYYWAQAWQADRLAGLREGAHGGRPRRLDRQAEATLEQVLASDPQTQGYAATDWTVPLGRCRCCARPWPSTAMT